MRALFYLLVAALAALGLSCKSSDWWNPGDYTDVPRSFTCTKAGSDGNVYTIYNGKLASYSSTLGLNWEYDLGEGLAGSSYPGVYALPDTPGEMIAAAPWVGGNSSRLHLINPDGSGNLVTLERDLHQIVAVTNGLAILLVFDMNEVDLSRRGFSLIALNIAGSKVWDTQDLIARVDYPCSKCVGTSQDAVYLQTGTTLYAVDFDGGLLWTLEGVPQAYAIHAAEQTYVVFRREIVALSPDGEELWRHDTGNVEISSNALLGGGIVFSTGSVGAAESDLVCLDSQGAVAWSTTLTGWHVHRMFANETAGRLGLACTRTSLLPGEIEDHRWECRDALGNLVWHKESFPVAFAGIDSQGALVASLIYNDSHNDYRNPVMALVQAAPDGTVTRRIDSQATYRVYTGEEIIMPSGLH